MTVNIFMPLTCPIFNHPQAVMLASALGNITTRSASLNSPIHIENSLTFPVPL